MLTGWWDGQYVICEVMTDSSNVFIELSLNIGMMTGINGG